MKSSISKIAAAGWSFLLLLGASSAAEETIIFTPEASLTEIAVPDVMKQVQRVSFTTCGGRSCVRTEWKDLKHPWTRLDIKRPLAKQESSTTEVSVQVYLEEKNAGDINLRFSDRTGEMFQLRQLLKKQTGWQQVSFKISAGETLQRHLGRQCRPQTGLSADTAGLQLCGETSRRQHGFWKHHSQNIRHGGNFQHF